VEDEREIRNQDFAERLSSAGKKKREFIFEVKK
jgi:hypothetical protein